MTFDIRTETPGMAYVRQLLEQSGIRPTAQRLKVAEVLLSAPRHLTAEQLLVTLRQSPSRVSKATVPERRAYGAWWSAVPNTRSRISPSMRFPWKTGSARNPRFARS